MAIKHLKTSEFESAITGSGKLKVIDFFADWCGPCKMLGPVLEQAAAEQADVEFFKVNIDEEEELAMKYRVMTIPTLLFIKDGEVLDKTVGLISKKDLENHINKNK